MANYTWQDLKDFANSLNEEQLKENVWIDMLDQESVKVTYAELIDEDVYVHKDDPEDVFLMSLKKEYEYMEDKPVDMKDYYVCVKKGTPFLSVDDFLEEDINK